MTPIRSGSLDEFLQAWQQDALKAVQPPGTIVRVPLPEAWRPFSTGPTPVPKPDDKQAK